MQDTPSRHEPPLVALPARRTVSVFQDDIVSDRLRIRPIVARDARVFATLGRDPEVFRWIPEIDVPFDAETWVRELMENPENFLRHAVEIDRTGRVIGAVQLNRRNNLQLQIGYWFGKPFWGQGYATETVEAVMRFLDQRTSEPVHAAVHPDNVASRQVLENNGFVCLKRYLREMLEYRRVRP